MSARAPRSAIDGLVRPRNARGRNALGAAAILAVALVGAASAYYGVPTERPSAATIMGAVERGAAAAGIKPIRYEVRGNRYTSNADVGEALQLHNAVSQLSFDISAAQRRIEALPWVDTAVVQRLLPDAIVVDIVERKPAIVWRDRDRDVLVDMRGRELTSIARGTDTGLPVVTGDAAGPVAPLLVSLIGQHPYLARRVLEMRRVEGRRWTLQLDSGTVVHLPADGTAAAIAWLDGQLASGLLDMPLGAIDLRVAGQLVVRTGRHGTARVSEAAGAQVTPRSRSAGGHP